MRILITGSREWTDEDKISEAFDNALREMGFLPSLHHGVIVIHGGADGADRLAGQVAARRGWRVEVYPASWKTNGPKAGVLRNQEMVDEGADMCLAFFKDGAENKGTTDCVKRAEKAGIKVRRYEG
jgi:hypothetical protein